MASIRITERALQGLKLAAARAHRPLLIWDTDIRGFGCRASPSGSLSFIFQVWEGGKGGKAKRITLTQVTLEKARLEAQSKRVEANQGCLTSPKLERLKLQRALLQQKTISQAVSAYLEENKEPGRYWEELEQRFNKQITPALKGARRITEITSEDLRELLRAYSDRPVAKRNTYWALSGFFKWCLSEGYTTHNPLASLPIPRVPNSRDRTLSKGEIKLLWDAASQLGYPWASFYKLLLLTAQRREEVAGMEWKELDLDQSLWVIPGSRTKNKKEHIVHLSPLAMASLPLLNKSRYVFLSSTGKTSISSFSDAKIDLDKLLPSDMPPWRIHDLRRTAKTGFASLGVPKEVSEKILNHVSNSSSDLETIYNRYQYLEERKEALTKWGEYIANLVSYGVDSESPNHR
jgi:integrase